MRPAPAIAAALSLALAACGHKPANQQQGGEANQAQGPAGSTAGVTPMADRVAVIGFLNKRNGIVHNFRLRPGQSVRVKDAYIHLRACETTAPWEEEKLTGAFLQLDVQGPDKRWRRVFSGWVYKESPSLNMVQHPVYDVWPRSCAMSFPPGPPPPPGTAPGPTNRSSAQKSAGNQVSPAVEAPSPSAADNNAT